MQRFLLTIKYDGTNFCGWQVQPNGVSVQSVVQKALIELTNEAELCVTGCSRTDSGVHANMFCLHFDSETTIRPEKIPFALNMKLPEGVCAVGCRVVSNDFHARYSSNGKTYIYKIYNSPLPDPFKEKYYLRVNRNIDVDLLNEACKYFVGEHDFASFCASGSSVTDTVRTVSQCFAERQGEDIIISITSNGFLYNMVRIIVGTLLDVNSGKFSPEDIREILNACDRSAAGFTVKPHGLYLQKVHYDF